MEVAIALEERKKTEPPSTALGCFVSGHDFRGCGKTQFLTATVYLLCQPRTFSPGERVFRPAETLGLEISGFSPGGCFSRGPDFFRSLFIRTVEVPKDLGFRVCGSFLQEHFLQDAPWQGLKPNLFQFLDGPTKEAAKKLTL